MAQGVRDPGGDGYTDIVLKEVLSKNLDILIQIRALVAQEPIARPLTEHKKGVRPFVWSLACESRGIQLAVVAIYDSKDHTYPW